jgi:transcriptional regulator with XRE-family HTH domain
MKRNKLRVIRADKRITQDALAARTARIAERNPKIKHVSQSRISLIENGFDAEPEERRAIARALGMPIQAVFPPPDEATR